MNLQPRILLLVIACALFLAPASLLALDARQQRDFDRVAGLTMAELTRESARLLEQKYPNEDWDRWRFPTFVFTSESVEIGYKIAVKEPQILSGLESPDGTVGIPCYCFCDVMGHKTLLHCFWKDGKVGGTFDEHAAGCNICYGQAMLAFLWNDLGASKTEILAGMEKKFAHLPKPK